MNQQNNIDELLKLDDEELKKRITAAAVAAGADSKKILSALSDMQTLRRLASGLSQEQINSLLNTFGAENAKKIATELNNSKSER